MFQSFPPWVARIRDPQEQAAARLRYMLARTMLHVSGDTKISRLAKDIGYDHSSVCCAIQRGRMSYEMAMKIEKKFGRQVIQHEALIDPMSV